MAQLTWLQKAEQYLVSAQLLLESLDKVDWNSSLSRSYYASRFICLYFLEQEGLAVDRKWTHESVLNLTVQYARNKQWLQQVVMAGQQDLAKSLNKLLTLRGDADYSQAGIKERQARHALDFAQALLQAIRDNQP